jgi:hypothetical protein
MRLPGLTRTNPDLTRINPGITLSGVTRTGNPDSGGISPLRGDTPGPVRVTGRDGRRQRLWAR